MPIKAFIKDSLGNPVKNVVITPVIIPWTFTVPIEPATQITIEGETGTMLPTDENGSSIIPWVLSYRTANKFFPSDSFTVENPGIPNQLGLYIDGKLYKTITAYAIADQTSAALLQLPFAVIEAFPNTAFDSPKIRLYDQFNNYFIGATVECNFTNSSGVTKISTVKTDVDGFANCGALTLGSAEGSNTLTFNTLGLSHSVTVASKNIILKTPTLNGSVVNDLVDVDVRVDSQYQLASVVAGTDLSSINLAYNSGNSWIGQLSLASTPAGPVTIHITAKDILNNETSTTALVRLDRPPVLTINAPTTDSVVSSNFNTSVSCVDDDANNPPVISIKNVASNTILTTRAGSITEALSLTAYSGQQITLEFSCVDSSNKTSIITRKIYVEDSTKLTPIANINGEIWDTDADGTRVLYLEGTTLRMKNKASNIITDIDQIPMFQFGRGYLTPRGAIYVRQPFANSDKIIDWNGVTGENLSTMAFATLRRTNGKYSLYSISNNNNDNLYLRDLTLGSSTFIQSLPGNAFASVEANGNVAFYDTLLSKLSIVKLGMSKTSISAPFAGMDRYFFWSDGTSSMYQRNNSLIFNDGITESVLASGSICNNECAMGNLNAPVRNCNAICTLSDLPFGSQNGYTAFTKTVTGGIRQTFFRDLTGTIHQLTLFGNKDSLFEAIGPDGTVFIKSYPTGTSDINTPGILYRATPNQPLEEIGSALGKVIFRDGKPLILIGGTVFEINQ